MTGLIAVIDVPVREREIVVDVVVLDEEEGETIVIRPWPAILNNPAARPSNGRK